ncbi:hypothetical protein EVAR_59757_1 [Eumeta japonica]|uniref:RNA-directed DNA polymerase from mobile element jockey n=1 Tax=Eumeta variegata TaxID=151549 RepID=A0A4C1ZL39_EUMVA|nr:hypothetical protein EVAR_59757_1 [Eumeta japonica]
MMNKKDILREVVERTSYMTTCTLGVRVATAEEKMCIVAIYKPPGSSLYVQDIHTLLSGPTPTLITRHLNTKYKAWGSHSVNRAERCLMEDAESRGYKVLDPDAPTYVPTDPCHRADVLDIVLSHKMCWPTHIEVVYGMATQHIPILITVEEEGRHSLPRPTRPWMDRTTFHKSFETLHLGSPRETPEDVETSASLLVDNTKEAQRTAAASQQVQISRCGDLPFHLKEKIQHKRRLHKL